MGSGAGLSSCENLTASGLEPPPRRIFESHNARAVPGSQAGCSVLASMVPAQRPSERSGRGVCLRRVRGAGREFFLAGWRLVRLVWTVSPETPQAAPSEYIGSATGAISLGPNATVGAGNYPAKFSFDITTANCGNAAKPDFVVFITSVATSGQASVVAYDNLYSGCATGMVPSTYWAYNTGGAVVTSVTLSLDGSQVAFVQTPTTAPIANLVLLKWKPTTDSATSASPDSISIVLPSAYPTCTAPCMTTLGFSGGANDTNSSPFYDFANDTLYAGDDGGRLHKFHPVFGSGTPVEVGSPWPVLLGSGANKLDSPVLDSVTGRVFAGTLYNGTSGAQLFAINSSTGTVVGTSSSLGKGNGIADAPVVDPTTGKVYAFLGNDGSTNCSGPCGAVHQFATSFASGTGISAAVGFGGSITLYAGSFDNAYYTSADGTGTLFVCGLGFPGFFPAEPMILRIPISAGTMSASSQFGAGLGTGNVPCSPVTEVFNPAAGSGRHRPDLRQCGVEWIGSGMQQQRVHHERGRD